MLTVQPPFIADYFVRNKIIGEPKHGHRSFYLSWEDAFWQIVNLYITKPSAVVLVPEFYCGNVIEHMREHGLVVKTYPVDAKLQTNSRNLIAAIKATRPDIVIIFHAAGIPNTLFKRTREWLPRLGENVILIEDSVHNIIDPQKIIFLNQRHFLIDSLRKVVPVQGSNLYSPVPLPTISILTQLRTAPYRLGVLGWWTLMQIFLVGAYWATNKNWQDLCNRIAEWAMLQGYNLIGKSRLPSVGISYMDPLSRKIATAKIERVKYLQAKAYRSALERLLRTDHFWLPDMKVGNDKYLRGFPLIVDLKIAPVFLKYFRSAGVMLRFELDDCVWSERQKIVYLPMGLHICDSDLKIVIDLLARF